MFPQASTISVSLKSPNLERPTFHVWYPLWGGHRTDVVELATVQPRLVSANWGPEAPDEPLIIKGAKIHYVNAGFHVFFFVLSRFFFFVTMPSFLPPMPRFQSLRFAKGMWWTGKGGFTCSSCSIPEMVKTITLNGRKEPLSALVSALVFLS